MKDLSAAANYFDANRKLKGIKIIKWVEKISDTPVACPSGTVEEPLYAWPGTYAGYKNGDNKYERGTSKVFTEISEKSSQNANYWKWGKFCI